MRVKITEAGFAGYTGPLGSTEFVDGISVDPVNEREALRLGSIMHMTEIDEDGEHLGQVSVAVEAVQLKSIGAPIEVKAKTQAEIDVENKAKAEADGTANEEAAKAAELEAVRLAAEPAKVYTRAELEAVADADGIKGLRKVSDPLNVKSTAIPDLIERILVAQEEKAKAAPAA